jgi:hypothetical protein
MAAPKKHQPRKWEIDDLLDLGKREKERGQFLKAVPVIILEKWVREGREKDVANYIRTKPVARRLVDSGLHPPFKPKGSSNVLATLSRIQLARNLTRPPLIESLGGGEFKINLPRYEKLLEKYRQEFRKRYSKDYEKLFREKGEPDWGLPSEPVEQEEGERTPSVPQGQDQIETVLEPVRQLLLELTEENRRLRELERENEELRKERERDTAESIDLFVSYSHFDSTKAKSIVDSAEKKNLRVFQDEKIDYGADFGEEIRRNLLRSRELCILVTPNSLKSEWVTTEWGAAWALDKRITPILLRCAAEQLPARLQRLRCVDLDDVGEYLDRVAERKSPL